MNKNRVVVFNENDIAKVFIVDDIDAFQKQITDETYIINPDLSLVYGVPPELWRVDHLKNIVPITDPQEIARRQAYQKVFPIIRKNEDRIIKELHKLLDINQEFQNLIRHFHSQATSINDTLETFFNAHANLIEHTRKNIAANYASTNDVIRNTLHKQQVDFQKTEKKLLLATILNLILFIAIFITLIR